MSIFKPLRNGTPARYYHYDFSSDDHRYQGSTKLTAKREAQAFVDKLRGQIRLGQVDAATGRPFKREAVPTLREFQERFFKSIETRCAEHPATVQFYRAKMKSLLAFTPIGDVPLNKVDERLIESYIQHRRVGVSPGTVNRELATLKRSLRLAQAWRVIDRVPRIEATWRESQGLCPD